METIKKQTMATNKCGLSCGIDCMLALSVMHSATSDAVCGL